MRQIYDFCQRAIQRVNARIAILVVVVAAGGIAVWQGFAHLPRKEPDLGPKKQVATGLDAAGGAKSVEQVGASLSDDELPAQSTARLGLYDQAGDSAGTPSADLAPPSTSPYMPAASDAASGYQSSAALSPSYSPNPGGASYGGSYGGTTATASDVPNDPTAAVPNGQPAPDSLPANP